MSLALPEPAPLAAGPARAEARTGLIAAISRRGRWRRRSNGRPAARAYEEAATPIGLILLPSSLLIADSLNHRIRFITKDANVSTFAGSAPGFLDGPASTALFNNPTELAYAPDGTVYISDHLNHAIRLISPSGLVSTLVGLSGTSGMVDGPPSIALLSYPRGLTLTPDGSLLVADTGNRSIRNFTIP